MQPTNGSQFQAWKNAEDARKKQRKENGSQERSNEKICCLL